jgi:bacterioferritin
MLENDQLAERIAIDSYREMINVFGQRDPTSRRLLESILAQEEEHAEDLVDLLEDLPKD